MSFTETLQQTLQVTGTDNNTWGAVANLNFAMEDQGINGVVAINAAGNSNITLSFPAGTNVSNQAINRVLVFYGALTGNIVIFYPATNRRMRVLNATSGAYTLSVAVTGTPGTAVLVPQGTQMELWTDGTNVNNGAGPASVAGGYSATGSGPMTVLGGLSVDTLSPASGNLTVGGNVSIGGGGQIFAAGVSVSGSGYVGASFGVAGVVSSGSAVYGSEFLVGSGLQIILTGAGTPTGSQPNSSIYLNTTGATGARVWVSTGTGWNAVAGV